MLGSCSMGVQQPLRVGAANQGSEKPKGPFLRTAGTGRTALQWKQILHGWAELPLSFLGCRPFPGGWRCWVLLHGGVAPPEDKQARGGKAPVVVSFPRVVRTALQDGRQPHVWHTLQGRVGGMHRAAQLSASCWASELTVVQGVFYGGLPLLLSPPQHWCLVSPSDPALLPGSL